MCASTQIWAQQQVTIKGYALPENKKVTLKALDHVIMDYVSLDSQYLQADKAFDFKTPFTYANLYQLVFDDKVVLPLSVDNTQTISVTRKEQETVIEGSSSTLKMRAFKKENQDLQAKYFGQLKADLDKAMADKDEEKTQALMKAADIALEQFLQEFRKKLTGFGATPAGYYALQFSDFNKELDFLQERLKVFKKEAPNCEFTLALEKQIYQATVTAVGKMPPLFEVKDIHNQLITLNDFKGKILLIDFWASWCRACRVENPKFVNLYNQYHNRDFEIISISKDEKKENWLEAMDKDGIKIWKHIWDSDETISKLYSVSSLPQNLVIDKEGKIIAKNVNAEQLAALLQKIIK